MTAHSRANTTLSTAAEPSITRHYILVLVTEALVILGLQWLSTHFR